MFYVEYLGAVLSLLIALSVGGLLAKAFLLMVWRESSNGNVVDTTDALIVLGLTGLSCFQLLRSNWVATVCTVVVFLLLVVSPEVSIHASIGCSSIVFTILGYLAPMAIRQIRSDSKSISD